jgi:hypothetical protein
VTGSYTKTRVVQTEILRKVGTLLRRPGYIIALECVPQGIFGDTLCSYLINRITSSTMLARVVKSAGANTAGVGVCFLGKRQWESTFDLAGLHINHFHDLGTWGESIGRFHLKRLVLTMKKISSAYFFLSPANDLTPTPIKSGKSTNKKFIP